jgi:hypothetical protein
VARLSRDYIAPKFLASKVQHNITGSAMITEQGPEVKKVVLATVLVVTAPAYAATPFKSIAETEESYICVNIQNPDRKASLKMVQGTTIHLTLDNDSKDYMVGNHIDIKRGDWIIFGSMYRRKFVKRGEFTKSGTIYSLEYAGEEYGCERAAP